MAILGVPESGLTPRMTGGEDAEAGAVPRETETTAAIAKHIRRRLVDDQPNIILSLSNAGVKIVTQEYADRI